jgi:hypothetical protein
VPLQDNALASIPLLQPQSRPLATSSTFTPLASSPTPNILVVSRREHLQPIIPPPTQVNRILETRKLRIAQIRAVQHAQRVQQEHKRQQAVVEFTEDGVFFCLRDDYFPKRQSCEFLLVLDWGREWER